MSNFSDFIGGGGSASFPTFFLHKSQTWVPPQDGNIMIHVIGAGGSGSTSNVFAELQSGAAGGYCKKNSLAVTTSGSFTVVIGAGGAPTVGAYGAGNAGGTTTFSGTGLSSTLTATGGAAGALSNGTYTTGGTASNGDVNNAGGRGGFNRGGGAVGLTGTGNDGILGDKEWNLSGSCDILGDFYSSSFGQISGSSGGGSHYNSSNYQGYGPEVAGPLAGGVVAYKSSLNMFSGHASIGGGGGYTYAPWTRGATSGRGGEGCVVIQYIV